MQLKLFLLAFLVILSQCLSSERKKLHRRGKHSLLEIRRRLHHDLRHYLHHRLRPHKHRGKHLKKAKVVAHHERTKPDSTVPALKQYSEVEFFSEMPSNPTSRSRTPSSSSSSGSKTKTNAVLDVGMVSVVSRTETCTGVLLDPSLVLTSATCVFPNRKSPAFKDIHFQLNGVTSKVTRVYGDPEWLLTAQRQSDFAILVLAKAMTNMAADQMTSLTWSPYALEDIGESFMATPNAISCQTASKKAQKTDRMRHVGNEIITVTCTNGGLATHGSPLYRMVGGKPVVFGIHFGTCTSGTMDRKMTGLCSSRISKQAYEDICRIAKQENIDLQDCSSKLLKLLDARFPTVIYDNGAYDAVLSTADNLKGAVIIYYSSNIEIYHDLVFDIDDIQRMKVVYDKFQIALVDIQKVPFNLDYEPLIEFRTAGAKLYLRYDEYYKYEQFKKFMKEFSEVGAPPAQSTSFAQVMLHDDVEMSSRPNLKRTREVQSGPGTKVRKLECDDNGQSVFEIDRRGSRRTCECKPGYIGSGTTGNCRDRHDVIQENCLYAVENKNQGESDVAKIDFDTLVQQTMASDWCTVQKFVFSFLSDRSVAVHVAGAEFHLEECNSAIEDYVVCDSNDLDTPSRERRATSDEDEEEDEENDQQERSLERRKRTVSSAGPACTAPNAYLSNFLNDQPPGPIHTPANSFFIVQDWVTTAENKFSTLFDGNRGIPEFSAYKLNETQMSKLKNGNTTNRNLIATSWYFDNSAALKPYGPKGVRQGKNTLYLGRGNKTAYADAVDKGHLNPSHINAFDADTMKLTHTHTNAYPQFSYFNIKEWRDYESKIFKYATNRCYGRGNDTEFHLVTGLSDYKIVNTGAGKTASLTMAKLWPKENESNPAVRPVGTRPLGRRTYSIIQAISMWTVGCCTWKDRNTSAVNAESISIWANNEPNPIRKEEHEPNLPRLSQAIYPGQNMTFFPGNPDCEKNHVTL